MGANDFYCIAKGKTAQEAFNTARAQAQYDHGHAGYTGTVAEKGEFVMVPMVGNDPSITTKDRKRAAYRFAETLIEARDERISDKWGPAGCIDVGDGVFLFFGWASS